MIFHCNTSSDEFIAWLRYNAIKGGMPPQFIDCVDRLASVEDLEAELADAGDELVDAERDRDDLLEELEALVKALDENLLPDLEKVVDLTDGSGKVVENALAAARSAIERHSK